MDFAIPLGYVSGLAQSLNLLYLFSQVGVDCPLQKGYSVFSFQVAKYAFSSKPTSFLSLLYKKGYNGFSLQVANMHSQTSLQACYLSFTKGNNIEHQVVYSPIKGLTFISKSYFLILLDRAF